MKLIRIANLLVIALALSVAALGCKPQNLKKIPGQRAEKTPDIEPMPPINSNPPPIATDNTAGMVPMSDAPGHENWISDTEKFKANTVHFAFDSSVVTSADKSKVAGVADYLKANTQAAVRVEGNCDERGTEEYNRSLGERRALAVREQLVGLGIEASRIDTISYGEDKPVETGHNEAAWKQNRRADFVLLTPPAK